MTLQERIAAGAKQIKLAPDEYRGPLVIDRPCDIDGSGSTVWCDRGPVVTVRSAGVRLRNIRIEGTCRNARQEALVCEAGDTVLENVEVYGGISGPGLENGPTKVPRTIDLGRFAAESENSFVRELTLPAAARVRADIGGLRVEPSRLGPGKVALHIVTDKLRTGTSVYGEIFLDSAVTRRIYVRGRAEGDAPRIREMPKTPAASANRGKTPDAAVRRQEMPKAPAATANRGKAPSARCQETPKAPGASASRGKAPSARRQETPKAPAVTANRAKASSARRQETPKAPAATANRAKASSARRQETPKAPAATANRAKASSARRQETPKAPAATANRAKAPDLSARRGPLRNAVQLQKGERRGLPAGSVEIRLLGTAGQEIDAYVFLLNARDRVRNDDDFVFFGQPVSADGAVRIQPEGQDPGAQVELARVDAAVDRILVAFSHYASAGSWPRDSKVRIRAGEAEFEYPIQDPGGLRTLVAARLYRRNGAWRLWNTDQRSRGGIDQLCGEFGVEVE